MDQLGDPAPRRVLGLHHLADQLPAFAELILELGDPRAQLGDLVAHYSSRPRRIASATAAARSETPSFS